MCVCRTMLGNTRWATIVSVPLDFSTRSFIPLPRFIRSLSVPLDFSTRSFIPLPRFIRSRPPPSLLAPSLVLLPPLCHFFNGSVEWYVDGIYLFVCISGLSVQWWVFMFELSHVFLLPIKKISEQPCSNGESIRHTVLWEGIRTTHKLIRRVPRGLPTQPSVCETYRSLSLRF